MVRMSEDLIRRKAEHHDGLMADLEEITLHQLEIEKIEIIGTMCRKLKILYLQNNIISKIENLQHMKDLRYLNMALNNITVVEGLASCEFLRKLDFTVNFIDIDALESSWTHLAQCLHLQEIYMMGNPCTNWEGFRSYTICMLPQLQQIDGQEITRTERITSAQAFKQLRSELRELAAAKRIEKGLPVVEEIRDEDDDTEAWSPEARVRMYREMAEQKEEKEKAKKANEPQERNYALEQAAAIEKTRQREANGIIRQCNEGKWEFSIEEEDGDGNCVFRMSLSRFLDTSLIDVDVHPTYISIIIKGKVFRLLWPEEVRASDGTCQRSQGTGELVVTAPKIKVSRSIMDLRRREKKQQEADEEKNGVSGIRRNAVIGKRGDGGSNKTSNNTSAYSGALGAGASGSSNAAASSSSKPTGTRNTKLADELLAEATRAVSIAGIAKGSHAVSDQSSSSNNSNYNNESDDAQNYVGHKGEAGTSLFRATGTTRTPAAASTTTASTAVTTATTAVASGSSSAAVVEQTPVYLATTITTTTVEDFVNDDDVPPLE